MGQNRLNLPNGAESTWLERPGRVEPQEENPPAVLPFSDHLWTNLTSQPQRNGIRRIPILKLRLTAKLLNKLDIRNGVSFYLPLSSMVEL